MPTQLPTDLKPIPAGQFDVQKHKIERTGHGPGDTALSVGTCGHGVALFLEALLQQKAQRAFVFDKQNSPSHGSRIPVNFRRQQDRKCRAPACHILYLYCAAMCLDHSLDQGESQADSRNLGTVRALPSVEGLEDVRNVNRSDTRASILDRNSYPFARGSADLHCPDPQPTTGGGVLGGILDQVFDAPSQKGHVYSNPRKVRRNIQVNLHTRVAQGDSGIPQHVRYNLLGGNDRTVAIESPGLDPCQRKSLLDHAREFGGVAMYDGAVFMGLLSVLYHAFLQVVGCQSDHGQRSTQLV